MIELTCKKIKNINIYLIFTYLFCFVGFFVYLWFYLTDKTLIWKVDDYKQYYPGLVSLHLAIKNLVFNHRFDFWNWNLGLGEDTIGTLYSMYLDPFSYIAASFPVKDIDVGYGFANFLRLYFAGISMLFFCKKRFNSRSKILLGAISYSFCGWAITCSTSHCFFLVPLILFPLLIEGVIEWKNNRRWKLLFTSVFFSLVTCIYFAWMSAVAVIVFIITFYLLEENNKNLKGFCSYFFPLVGIVILAVIISLPFITPVVFSILQASKSSGAVNNNTFTMSQYLLYVPSFTFNRQYFAGHSVIYVNAFTFSMLPAIILKTKTNKKNIAYVSFIIWILACLIPAINRIFNGFSYPTGRWFYVIAFFFIWSSLEALDIKSFCDDIIKYKYIKLFSVLLSILLAFFIISSLFTENVTKINMVETVSTIIFSCFIIFTLFNKQSKSTAVKVLLLTCFSIMISGLIIYNPFVTSNLENFLDAGQCYEKYNSSNIYAANSIKGNKDFYRVISTGFDSRNESLIANTHTNCEFWSVINSNWIDFQRMTGDSQGIVERVWTETDYLRSRVAFLEGVKYCADSNYRGYGFNKKEKKVLVNDYNAGLGYVYDYAFDFNELNKYSYTEILEIMMQAVIVDKNNIEANYLSNEQLKISSKNIVKSIESNNIVFSDNYLIVKNNSELVITTNAASNSEIYVLFKNLNRIPLTYDEKKEELNSAALTKYDKYKNAKSLIVYQPKTNFNLNITLGEVNRLLENRAGSSQAILDYNDYMTCMGYYNDLQTDSEISVKFNTAGMYSYDSIEVIAVSQEPFDKQAKKLEEQRLNVSRYNGNYVEGNVTAENDGILFLSIPYNYGWKVYVDGKQANTFKANIGFTGVNITKGKHSITMKYRPPFFNISCVLSLIGVFILLVIIIFEKKRRILK